MQMTTKLNVLAAAVGLALSIGAQAVPISSDGFPNDGGGAGAGNLVLAMFDGGSSRSLVFNTGLTAASFNAQSTASFNVSVQNTDLTKLNNFIGTVGDLSKFGWNIVAIDNRIVGGQFWDSYGFQSTAAVGTSITTANGPNSADPGITDALSNANVYFSAQSSKLASSNVAVTDPDVGLLSFKNAWGNNLGGSTKIDNLGRLGASLSYFFFHGVGEDPGFGQVASDKYTGKWKLDFTANTTKLSYTVPVSTIPVPPAALLMGSAIAGLIATRRRKAS